MGSFPVDLRSDAVLSLPASIQHRWMVSSVGVLAPAGGPTPTRPSAPTDLRSLLKHVTVCPSLPSWYRFNPPEKTLPSASYLTQAVCSLLFHRLRDASKDPIQSSSLCITERRFSYVQPAIFLPWIGDLVLDRRGLRITNFQPPSGLSSPSSTWTL